MLDLKIPPIVVLSIFSGVIISIPFVFPFYEVKSIWLSTIFIISGIVVALMGVWEFRRLKTTVNPTTPEKSSRMVSTGIYRFSRNPMYLGMAFGLVGLVFYFGNCLSWFGVAGFVAYITYFQIIPEEVVLKRIFGKSYEDYCQKTRRWF
ncbi:hypothetical protein CGC49_03155 [Capnocytophaga sp. H4358]|uniref:methyltransferase family protein n=1 Tax=Capnocytophaga sp. H4358 TaxID=1945658 RepID=UPI000BB18F25|nr:isoprenylcysteine carboxylmethyltransferase family protein [Capnocytophaga sp. H4358]ATA72383.1 hypothetical protein CGC49_03155 [Capnocytophaga sp. H4358]